MGIEVCVLCLSQQLQAPDTSVEVFASPPVNVGEDEEVAEQPREKANMMPSTDTEEKSDGVILRVSSGPRPDPDKRKSGNESVSQRNNSI